MTDIAEQFEQYKTEIQRILDKTARPDDRVPDADMHEILRTLKKIGRLGTQMRASAKAALPQPERPDPLGAGARLHALAVEKIEASGGTLTYSQAWATLVMEHWPLIQEWQQSVQAPRRRR